MSDGATMSFILPWPPSVNNYLRHGRRGTYRTPQAKGYRELIRLGLAIKLTQGRFTGFVRVSLECYPPDRRRRDIDNLLKVLLDSLNGIAWDDDSQVKELRVKLHDQVDPDGGSVWCTISSTEKRT
jgi:crossover junction endodeoxyribonuclease RusA